VELLSSVYRNDLCNQALELAGFSALRPERHPFALADGRRFDQDDPLAYLKELPFATPSAVEPITLPGPAMTSPVAAR
jgi:hypothetical protein